MCLKCALPRIILLVLQAAWGGGLLMSSTQRAGKFSGVERADSLTWNPDKLLGVLPGGEVQGVVVVEGGVAGDEHEAGAEDPEHEASGSGEQEEGDRAEADTHVLLGQAYLMTWGMMSVNNQ